MGSKQGVACEQGGGCLLGVPKMASLTCLVSLRWHPEDGHLPPQQLRRDPRRPQPRFKRTMEGREAAVAPGAHERVLLATSVAGCAALFGSFSVDA